MNNPQLTSTCEVKINNPRQRLPLDVPSIRILLYADDPNGIRTGNDTSDLNTMIDHLRARDPAFGHFEVTWMSRNCPGSDNRLTPQRLQLFDEIWFFGIHQLNNEPDAPQRGGNGCKPPFARAGSLGRTHSDRSRVGALGCAQARGRRTQHPFAMRIPSLAPLHARATRLHRAQVESRTCLRFPPDRLRETKNRRSA